MQQPKGVSMGMFDAVTGLLGDIGTAYANHREAEMSRDWQEYMSNTSYQRTVQDLNAAGLSPMLAYSKGGASTPSGAQAAPAPQFGQNVYKATENELTRAQVDVAKAQEQVNINNARLAAENAKKTAIEVEQMPVKFYYDLAEAGSRIDNNSAAANRNRVGAINDANLEAPGTGNPLIRDLKSGLRGIKERFTNSAQDFWRNLTNPVETIKKSRRNLGLDK